jgi:hypothetical protein
MPRGGCWRGVAPLENFVGKNIEGGTKGKIGRSLPPLENFVGEKSQRENLTSPRIFEIFRVSPPWREVVWASLLIIKTLIFKTLIIKTLIIKIFLNFYLGPNAQRFLDLV